MSSNNVKILDAARKGKNRFSKKDIAAETGLAWGTMHKAVDALIKREILFPTAEKAVGPGRPSVPLRLNADAVLWCGIDIGAYHTKLLFCDLNFNILYRESIPTQPYPGKKRFLKTIETLFLRSVRESGIDREKLSGIGLAVSGNVDSENAVIVSGGNFGIRFGENIALRELSETLNHPIFAVSTQTAAVCAEYQFGQYAGCSNLVTIGLGVGIGSGVIANHQLLISHPKRPVGYIGHILIPGNKYKCTCGFTGCLEAYSGGEYLRRAAMEAVPERVELHHAERLDRAAADGDPDAVKIMTTAATYNAAGIAAMIQLYAPEALVFSGGQVRPDGFLYRTTLAELRKLLPEERRDSCQISITVLGEHQSALGAARLACENFF